MSAFKPHHLICLAWPIFFWITGCSPERTPPETKPQEKTTPAPTSKKPEFFIGYESAPIPESLIQIWNKGRGFEVVQVEIDDSFNAERLEQIPLFLTGPRMALQLSGQLPLVRLSAFTGLRGVNPVFLSHPHDPQNIMTRPFRWTPLMVYHTKEAAKNIPALPTEVPLKLESVHAETETLLWMAIKMKDGHLQHIRNTATEDFSGTQKHETQSASPASGEAVGAPPALSEESIWQKLHDEKSGRQAILGANWRLSGEHRKNEPSPDGVVSTRSNPHVQGPPKPVDDGLAWSIPAQGTLIRVDLISIQNLEDQSLTYHAWSLLEFLMKPENQQTMVRESGYFSCLGDPKKPLLPKTPFPWPNGDWIAKSEIFPGRTIAGISAQAKPMDEPLAVKALPVENKPPLKALPVNASQAPAVTPSQEKPAVKQVSRENNNSEPLIETSP